MQATGGASSLEMGANITVAGLFIQLLFFGIFIVVAVSFHLKVRRYPTVVTRGTTPWERHMMALFLSSLLIMVRSIFRVVEYLQGFDGYLLSHEAYLYVFDALLMWLAMILFNWLHPAEILSVRVGNPSKATRDRYAMGPVSPSHRRLRSDVV